MVKNAGGNKAKGQARKFVTAPRSSVLRVSEDDCEVYAQVTKTLGNGMCQVLCIDNITRLCHIRGKFRGRGKRDNTIVNGTWILVGLREWELDKKPDGKKLQNCDLLEVYTNTDKEKLKSTIPTANWSQFIKNDNVFNNIGISEDDQIFTFTDEATEDYQKLIEAQVESESKGKVSSIIMDEEEINVDDI
jgi:translation initiation factor 1A